MTDVKITICPAGYAYGYSSIESELSDAEMLTIINGFDLQKITDGLPYAKRNAAVGGHWMKLGRVAMLSKRAAK